MTVCEEYINELMHDMPNLLTPKDLISCGIYKSHQAAYIARKNGTSPVFFNINHRGIVYPKKGIIEFLKNNFSTKTE